MTKKDKLFLGLLLLGPFFSFLPQYVSPVIMCWLDLPYYFLPVRELCASIVRSGILPLWNPYIYCGTPLLANMQSAVFDPLSIFMYVFPSPVAFKIVTFVAFYIAAVFTYAFVRRYGVSEEGALIAACVYSFTFYMRVKAVELADLHVMIWMPAVLFFAGKFLQQGKLYDMVFTSLVLSLSFLGGHPQVFFYVFILFTAIYFYDAITTGVDKKKYIKDFIFINLLFGAIVLLQALPSLEFVMLRRHGSELRCRVSASAL